MTNEVEGWDGEQSTIQNGQTELWVFVGVIKDYKTNWGTTSTAAVPRRRRSRDVSST